jgi:formylmethanofuran dehydrogenase subunit E
VLAELHRRMNSGEITPEEKARWKSIRAEIMQNVMAGRLEDLFEVGPARAALPEKARILASRTCDACGEAAMETRTRQVQGRRLCVPCSEKTAAAGAPAL